MWTQRRRRGRSCSPNFVLFHGGCGTMHVLQTMCSKEVGWGLCSPRICFRTWRTWLTPPKKPRVEPLKWRRTIMQESHFVVQSLCSWGGFNLSVWNWSVGNFCRATNDFRAGKSDRRSFDRAFYLLGLDQRPALNEVWRSFVLFGNCSSFSWCFWGGHSHFV